MLQQFISDKAELPPVMSNHLRIFTLIPLAVALDCGANPPAATSPIAAAATAVDLQALPPEEPAADAPLIEWERLAFPNNVKVEFDEAKLPQGVRDLVGNRIRLRGYVFDVTEDPRRIENFAMIGESDARVHVRRHWDDPIPLDLVIVVHMTEGNFARFSTKPVEVEGRFSIEVIRMGEKPLCIYRLDADSVKAAAKRDGYHKAVIGSGC